MTKEYKEETKLLIKPKPNTVNDVRIIPYCDELRHLIKLATPLMMTNLAMFLLMTETVMFNGKIGKYEMEGATLANSINSLCALSVYNGFCSACDTFFSQIYGSKHRHYLGIMLQRSILISIMISIITIPVIINWEPIFILMGQDVKVSLYASRFIAINCTGLIFTMQGILLTRYLQNQNYIIFPMISIIISNIFNIVSQYVFAIHLGFGFDASPVCQALAYFLHWLMQLIYILVTGLYKATWTGLSREAFFEWEKFLPLAISGIFLTFLEVFAWEIAVVLSGILGPAYLGAQSILFQYDSVLFTLAFAFSISVHIRVGRYLGAGQWRNAIRAYRCGLAINFTMGLTFSIVLFSFRRYAVLLFINDKEIIDIAITAFPFLLLTLTADFLNSVSTGALKGCGKYKMGVLFIFFGFYVLGQPTSICLTFLTSLKLNGLWIGLAISITISTIVANIYLNYIQNWRDQAKAAKRRIKQNLQLEKEIENNENTMSMGGGSPTLSLSTSVRPGKNPQTRPIVMKQVVTDKEYQIIYIKRVACYLFAIVLLVLGILIKVFLPRSLYIPHNLTDITLNL